MKNILKIGITTILLILTIGPVGYFLIYPQYNNLVTPIQNINIERYSSEISFLFLTSISPSKEEVMGIDNINSSMNIEESILENEYVDSDIEEDETKIYIDSVNIEGYIFEGSSALTMNKGFWYFPSSQQPGYKGNFVVIGHRYAKLPPNKDTFFNLDRVKVGDKIVVKQINDEYTYVVTSSKEVEKNDTSVLESYNDYRITLITCSPLWTSEKRLVIVGKLDKLYKNT